MSVIEKAREAVTGYDSIGEHGLISNYDMLSVVLGPFAKMETVERLSAYSLRFLAEMTVNEIEAEGLTHNQAVTLHAALLLGKRSMRSKKERGTIIRSPEDVANHLNNEMGQLNQEHFVTLMLNTRNEVMHKTTLFIGSLNASIVHPRELYREAVKCSAASVIVAHNHPSGSPQPSQEDVHITRRLAESGKMIGIELLDHVVIGEGRFVSLKEKGYL
ncbi:RadC family protein [Lentibacillus amyloliquefaciens]|uniref:DNA repair protein RadC n=1 Tax=Lentibacillus amyloliquefaciens TaxID=1472767 RepID=A0A0U4F4R6_9BACI|nr:DNA repair protein RadC [Lentibacillus amyloliquefaciens]ALX47763.1 DNA repair protein RadC [Lentibacillus amyloliquefaciens]